MSEVILEVKHVTKRFPGVIALNDISLEVNQGEIMAICGENGAGKSTLMRILSGSYPHTEYDGDVYFDGKKVSFTSVRDGSACGIEMVYQELNMVLTASVAENLFLSHLPGKGQMVNWKELYTATQQILDNLHISASPKQPAGLLNSGQLQLLSIMRAVVQKPRVIVLDEPTSSLTDSETDILFQEIAKLKAGGTAVIFISHKLEEVFQIADRITVMRDGMFVSVDRASDITSDQLIERMVGRKLENQYPKEEAVIGDEVFRVEHLSVPHPSVKDRYIVQDISFSLKKGEILGIGGLVGAGRSEALAGIFGQYNAGVKKKVFVEGKEVHISSPRQAKKCGIGFVTEERRLTGFIPNFSICNNLTLCILDKLPKGPIIQKAAERKIASSMFERLRIKAPSLDTRITNLSGGNQQKVVLGKWLLEDAKILFVDEPTKGIDVQAKAEIYKILSELTQQGVGIVMVTSDAIELLAMSDRCIVLSEGKITGEFEGDQMTQENFMRAAINAE
ncbi:MAG: sugar ABC transporter ATP-binding protein [Clostridiales bacterium]|nr:sugar ABC transporter ATP-binding protein [Clostridiales bacterium]